VTLDVLLLITGGILALIGAGIVVLLAPARYPTLLASIALGSLGLLQFGWARAVVAGPGGATWFELSLVFALSVSLGWVLLSRTLGMGPYPTSLGPWRFYVAAQALLTVGVLIWVTLGRGAELSLPVAKGGAFPLDPPAVVILVAILINLVLLTSSFESTYLALPRGPRRSFRPGLLGILLVAGYATYVALSSLVSGSVSSGDLSLGTFPVIALSLLLPISLIGGDLGEARVRIEKRPLTRTLSLSIAGGFLLATTALLWITHSTGWSVARGIWLLGSSGAALAVAALAVSNRLQRRVQRLIDPYLYRKEVDYRALSERLDQTVADTQTIADLCRLIPENARDLVGADPVTLFLAQGRDGRFEIAATTLEPNPGVSIGPDDPLPIELRRAQHAIRMRGRPDDLEYIPIYVENAPQILACAAICAAPLLRGEELFGFLLCGERGSGAQARRHLLPLLDLAARCYTAHFSLLSRPSRLELSRSGISDPR